MPTPHVVGHPRHRAPGLGDGCHQGIGVVDAEGGRHLVLLLQQQAVGGPARRPVQLHPGGRQRPAGAVEARQVDLVGKAGHGPGGGLHDVDVAQTPVRLLQVRLEQEGHVAVGPVAFLHLFGEHRQPVPGPGPPQIDGPSHERRHHVVVSRHQAAVEPAELRPQVLGRHAQHLGRAPHRMVEPHALVPHRVPDGIGDRLDVPPPLVHENDVEIAPRGELAPPIPSHRRQSDPVGVAARRLVEKPRQPRVGRPGQGAAEVVAVKVGSLDELLAHQAERHG